MLSMPRIVRPDPRDSCARKLGPPLDRLLADPLSETKNSPNFQNVFPGCRNQSYGAASRLATLTSTNGTRVFDKPSPKRRGRLIMDCRFICALCFRSACKDHILQATVYSDDHRLSWE